MTKHKSKAQSGIEMIIAITTIFIIVLLIQVTLIGPNNERGRDIKYLFEAKTISEDLCNAINQASYLQNGYSIPLKLSPAIDFVQNYSITIYDKAVSLAWQDKDVSCQIRALDILFYNATPPIQLNKTDLMISNINGQIVIS